ncbi:MAG: serine/threonine-protein kinase [Pseudomonadales bacterium]
MSQHKGDSKTDSKQDASGVSPALADRKTKVLPEAEVATLVADAEQAESPVAKPVPQYLTPGTLIKDRFVVEGQLGRGGMGVVYRVRDLRKEETNDRNPYLAMKVLNDQFRRDPRMITALQREAQKAQTLAHPNITTVYDFDRDEQLVFLTMELMQGDPLNEFIQKNPRGIPRERALEIIRGLCLGLAYAHNKNIIHSDFKPGNIFLTNDNRTKILDFGIARAAPVQGLDNSSELTQFDAGSLSALTPAYASYEMLSGQEPHPADDVFALAIVSYQLLTGRHPFNSHPASQARAQGLVPTPIRGIKRREWRAIAHGLAFDRNQRTGHAATFLREFEGSPRIRLALAAVASALVITSGYLVYEESRKMIANRPDVAFTELSNDVQQQFQSRLQEARMLESYSDYSSALDQYKAAYQLHPKNPEAVAALEAFFSRMHDLSIQDPRAGQLAVLQDNLAEVRSLDGYLANRPALKTLAETLHAMQ